MGRVAGETWCRASLTAFCVAMALLAPCLTVRAASALVSPGCLHGGTQTAVGSVDETLDLHLDDGRVARLVGIDNRRVLAGTRDALVDWLVHADVMLRPMAAEADRWGRWPVLAFAAPLGDPAHPVSVTEALLAAGHVLARPDPAIEACWANDLALERAAQRNSLGLWGAVPPVLSPGDLAALQGATGSFVLMEGRIAAVRDGHARLYLRFAEAGGKGAAVSLSFAVTRRLDRTLGDPHKWVGRRLLVRGLLDDRFGWQIDVTSAQQLQLDPP